MKTQEGWLKKELLEVQSPPVFHKTCLVCMEEQNYLENVSIFCLTQFLDPGLCDASAVLYQLSYQANWELIIMWVNDTPVDDGDTSIHVYKCLHELMV